MIDSVAIVSGGMDSVTLLHYLVKEEKRKPAVITFNYGQKHIKEVEFTEVHTTLLECDDHVVIDLALFRDLFSSSALVSESIAIPEYELVKGDPQPPTYVPNRNMIFLSLAAAYAESRDVVEVFYGAQRHDMYGYWDTTPQFLKELNRVFSLNRKKPIEIKAPFIDLSKADILRKGLDMEIDYGQTWSCYEGKEFACGHCPTCAERLSAFAQIGIPDPLPYSKDPSE